MRRRANLEPTINHERWLVSYADFVTLLFAFFVVMYSISQVSENKYRQLTETLDAVFSSSQQSDSRVEDVTTDNPSIQEQTIQEPSIQQQREEPLLNTMENLREEVLKSLSGLISQGSVAVNGDENWTEIVLDTEFMFASGQASLSDEARDIFVQLGNILSNYENMVAVGGHTDNVPINNARFTSNWELSSARAVSVVRFLSSSGINPQRLTAVGYGEFHPVATNDTNDGRNKNRRVVLRVTNKIPTPSVESSSKLGDHNTVAENVVSSSSDETQSIETSSMVSEELVVKPITLKDGSLLFTSDPDLPRVNNPPSNNSVPSK